MTLPGSPVPASIQRETHGGGPWITVIPEITLRRVLGILFQPERPTMFTPTAGGSLVRRHVAFAEWPTDAMGDPVDDPMPVHPGDQLTIPLSTQVISTVVSPPIPTTQTFAVTAGQGHGFRPFKSIQIGTDPVWQNGQLGTVVGDQLTLAAPLATAPQAGQTARQVATQYSIDEADCYEGHHIELYVRLVPHLA